MPFQPVDPRISFPKLEKDILQFWEDRHIFAKSLEKPSPQGDFIFHEGPPTANGNPGIHHVLTRAFKDAVLRYKTMQGYYAPRRAGWDTHGLPVELQVEKQLGISGKPQIETIKDNKEESIAHFNKLCRESVWQYKEEWEEVTRRMGFWLDMDDPYVTYENSYIEGVWRVLGKAWKKDLMYRGHKVVPYCFRCGTALSSHEVAQGYKDITDQSAYVKFKITNEEKTFLIAWTTTPWTLPGNVALAINPEIEYGIYHDPKNNEDYIISVSAGEKWQLGENLIKKIPAKELIGLQYEPVFDLGVDSSKYYRVAPADFVTDTDGTGVVHIAPAFGEDDYSLKTEKDLPILFTVNPDGTFTKEVTLFAGKIAVNQNDNILKNLKERDLLLSQESYKHSYPHCWRCDSKLIYYAKDSWFIAMSKLRSEMTKNNQQINWIPENIKAGRFGEWLANAKDWNLSRDRFWGTPLPIWENEDGSEYIFIDSIAELKRLATNFNDVYPDHKLILDQIDGIEEKEAEFDLHKPYIDKIIISDSHGRPMKRVPEVLDVWFDSGAMPYASQAQSSKIKNQNEAHPKNLFPADFICEAVDQTRGWFYTLHAISTIMEDGPAYKNVICLGHILDSKGQKMSKSKGNVLNPLELGDTHGFDAIRWYMYSVNQPGESKKIGEDDIKEQVRKFLLTLWNTYAFFVTYANLNTYSVERSADSGQDNTHNSSNLFDQWLISKRERLVQKVTESMNSYDIFTATRNIEDFVTDLSTWYVRRNKKRTDVETFLSILHETLVIISQIIAPFAPFVAEELYQKLTSNLSVHLSDFPAAKTNLINDEIEEAMTRIRAVVEIGHSLRKENKIKNRQPLAELVVQNIEFRTTIPDELRAIIMDELNVKSVNAVEQLPQGDNWASRHEFEMTVALDTTITPELKAEATRNDLIRLIQDTRKQAGYAFDDMVACSIAIDDTKVLDAIAAHKAEIMEQAHLSKIQPGEINAPDATLTGEIDGQKITISVKIGI